MASGSNPRRTRQRDRVQDDHRADPPTPQGGTPPKTRLANIPQRAIDKAVKSLRRIKFPEEDDDDDDDDDAILAFVWWPVHGALKQDDELKEHLVDSDGYLDNVTTKGKKKFIDSLRAMAANSDKQGSEAWNDLFEDGTSLSFFKFKHSDRVLHVEVFLKGMLVPNVDSLDEDTDADAHSQEGTQ